MPLLPGAKAVGRDSERRQTMAANGNGSNARTSSTSIGGGGQAGSSSASLSDTSSVHSYPPVPSQERKGSLALSTSTMESSVHTHKSKLGTRDDLSHSLDPWHYLAFQTSASGRSRQSSVVSYPDATSSPSALRSQRIAPSLPNPLAPLRKRLARSLGRGKRVSVELQLIIELVYALEKYCESFEASQGDSALLEEVTSLIKELIEVAPDAQQCLSQGRYGPLPFLSATIARGGSGDKYDQGVPDADWWPRRLARDCREILEEVRHASGVATEEAPGIAESKETDSSGDNKSSTNGSPLTAIESRSSSVLEHPLDGSTAKGILSESKIAAARKEELLEEGKRRWAAYRKRQQGLGDSGDHF